MSAFCRFNGIVESGASWCFYARCDFIDRDFHFAISPWVTLNGRDAAGTSKEDEIGTFVPTITIKDSTIVSREQQSTA